MDKAQYDSLQEAGVTPLVRLRKTHDVKCVQPHFDDVCSGRKTADLRVDDRDYQVGDILRQREFDGSELTGRVIAHEITHKLTGGPWLADGFCMLSLRRIPHEISF
jgi:hypothetical protein